MNKFAWSLDDIELEDELEVLGSSKSGNWGHAGRKGRKGGSAAGKNTSEARSQRASETYQPSTRETQKAAARSVQVLSRFLKGTPTKDHAAMDIIVTRLERVFGIEVKTLFKTKRDALTMHPSSRRRKIQWTEDNKASGHTIAVDRRGRVPVYYWREGFGSFSLNTMQRISLLELRKKFK